VGKRGQVFLCAFTEFVVITAAMARPIRIEFAGALYHVTARGNRQEDIFLGDQDRVSFLKILKNTVDRFNWLIHAYCLMDNHYHLLPSDDSTKL
jgi:putative transposase